MSKRVVAVVSRGMTDKTPVIVWEHEIAILEAIHGDSSVTRLTQEDLADRVDAIVIKGTNRVIDPKAANIRMIRGDKGAEEVEFTGQMDGKPQVMRLPVDRVNAQELVAQGLGVGQEFDGDPEEEYDRLVSCYGMHWEVKVPVVEYVYGRIREGRFAAAVAPTPKRRQVAEATA